VGYASQRLILLFGSKDVENIVSKITEFDGLLGEKYKQLVTRKIVLVE